MAKKAVDQIIATIKNKIKQKLERIYLVNYTMFTGEYEFGGHTVLTCKPRQRISSHVHEYFMDFWGKAEYERQYSCYMYNGDEVGVKKIYWRQITSEDRETLSRLGICL